jgi:hypothetical protein
MPERPQRGLVRDAAERHDGAQPGHCGDAMRKKGVAAGVDLGRRRLVLRRYAMHRVGDARVDQGQAVIRPRVEPAAGESEFAQRRIEQIAREVAGEGPPGAVRAA